MMDRILQDIGQTESTAEEIERKAAAEAARMVQQAHAQAVALAQEVLLSDEQRMAQTLSAHERQCNEWLSKQLGLAAQDAEKIRSDAQCRMEAAVSLIVEGVWNEYGHR